MKKLVALSLIALFVTGISCERSDAAMTKEEIYFMEIPVVVTAGRMEQKLTEASASVYVVTKEDIIRSGATSIPETLRMIPGVNVIQVTASNYSVSIRDVNKVPNDMVLVMIDGQIFYADHQGETNWEMMPISLEEIDRIEVVLGAGSVLYGANAYSGVINVITKTPEEGMERAATVTASQNNQILGTVRVAGKSDKIEYNVTACYDKIDQLDAHISIIPDEDEYVNAKNIMKGNTKLSYNLSDEAKIGLNVGYSRGDSNMGNATGLLQTVANPDGQALLVTGLTYNRPNLMVMLYRRWFDRRNDLLFYNSLSGTTPGSTVEQELLVGELQHTIDLGNNNTCIWGVVGQQKKAETSVQFELEKTAVLYAIYAQLNYSLMGNLSVIPAVRYDYHEITGDQVSPRLGFLYSISEDHKLRALYSRAFRAPTFTELWSYWVPLEVMGIPYEMVKGGGDDIAPMTIDSFELGYMGNLSSRLKGNMAVFYNIMDNYMEREWVGNFLGSPLMPMFVYGNASSAAKSFGAEVGFDMMFNKWLVGKLNYTYVSLEEENEDPLISWRVEQTPVSKINAGLLINKGPLSADVKINYIGETEWVNLGWGGGVVDAYTLINIRVAYKITQCVEVAAIGMNLGGNHYEYPAIEIPSSVMGSLSCKF